MVVRGFREANDLRSASGGVVMSAGALVLFFSRTQICVNLSSTDAEYLAMATGFREKIFMRYIWSFVFLNCNVGCNMVTEDNMGAIRLARTTL